MSILRASGGPTAEVSLEDAENLSQVASSFGARTSREARRRPGGFNRPVVGNGDYFVGRAGKVFRGAVKADPELRSLYLHAWSLSSRIEQGTLGPNYRIGGPSVAASLELVEVTTDIQTALGEKDLKVDLSGKWLDRAQDIAAFSLRVINRPETDYEQLVQADDRGRLYAGLSPELPINTASYWSELQVQLSPVASTIAQM